MQLIASYGVDEVRAYMRRPVDYTERLDPRRASILPDGDLGPFTDYIDDDGIDPEPIPICVTITIEDDQILVDFTGSVAADPGGAQLHALVHEGRLLTAPCAR